MRVYNKICQKIFFPLMDIANRTTIRKKLKFLEQSQWWPTEKLIEYQNEKLRRLIKHSYETVPYYRSIFKKINLKPNNIKIAEDLVKLPILTKRLVKENFQKLISKKHRQLTLYQTSGSTGQPTSFYLDKEADSWKWACELRGWKWAGYDIGDKHALMSGNTKRGLKKIKDIILRCAYMDSFNLNDKDLKQYIKLIKEKKIKSAIGYASAVYLLAEYAKKNKISLNLNYTITFGETLFPHYRKIIEKQFNCKINDTYGLGGEGLLIADQCENNDLYHINMENVFLETIKNDRIKSKNIENEIIATNLNNFSMPIIRYKTEDIGGLSKSKCSCSRGLLCLDSIKGRNTDIIITPNNHYLIVHFFTILFEHLQSINHFQIIQEIPEEITIKLVKNNKFKEKDLKYIKQTILKACNNDLKINFEFLEEIPTSPSGKRRFVISKIGLK